MRKTDYVFQLLWTIAAIFTYCTGDIEKATFYLAAAILLNLVTEKGGK